MEIVTEWGIRYTHPEPEEPGITVVGTGEMAQVIANGRIALAPKYKDFPQPELVKRIISTSDWVKV